MPDEYLIHDVSQSDQPSFGAGGTLTLSRVVTFYVGPHGPFRLTYAKNEATADRINADMNQEVILLRSTAGGM